MVIPAGLVPPPSTESVIATTSSRQPTETASTEPAADVSLDELEKRHILATLEKTHWNKSQTATMLGIERSTLDRKLKRYGVNRPGE